MCVFVYECVAITIHPTNFTFNPFFPKLLLPVCRFEILLNGLLSSTFIIDLLAVIGLLVCLAVGLQTRDLLVITLAFSRQYSIP